MVDRKLIEQLDSPSSDARKAAIQGLARTKDRAAIRYLEAVERLDADGAIREIARKAIAYIERNAEAQADEPPVESPVEPAKPAVKSKYAPGSIMAEYAAMEPEPVEESPAFAPVDRPVFVDVPESRQKNAKVALDMAGRAAFEEQNGRATKYLIEAFKLNPNLKHDAYAVGLAATVTGLYKTDAVKAIIDGSALELFDKKELTGKPRKKGAEPVEVEEDRPPAGWGTAIVDLLLYGLINAVIVAVTVIFVMNLLISSIQNDPALQAELGNSGIPAVALIDALSQVALPLMVVYALIYGLLAIVGLFITSFFIHVAARMILGGDGTMANLIHRTALFLGVMAALITVAQFAAFFLPVITSPTLGIGIYAAAFGLSVWTLIGYSSRIGKSYDMGAGKGCAALFLSIVFFTIVGVLCFALLGQALLAQWNSLLMIQATQGGFSFITPVP